MMKILAVCVATFCIGCKGGKQSDSAPPKTEPGSAAPTTKADAPAVAPTPTKPAVPAIERARPVIEAQIAAIKAGDDAKLTDTLDPGGIVMAPTGVEIKEAHSLATKVGYVNPHDTVKDIKLVTLSAGGNGDAVWLVAELAITKDQAEPGTKAQTVTEVVRASELLTASAGWKVVAAAFAEPQELRKKKNTWTIPVPTAAGPLATLLAAPDQIAAALSTDPGVGAIANGDKDFAVGGDAVKALLGTVKQHKLAISGAHEVHDAKWGFVQAMLDGPEADGKPFRLAGQLLALAMPDGSWQVVAVQYIGL